MGKVVAKDTVKVADRREMVVKGQLYDESDALVKAHGWLFEDPQSAAERQRGAKDTDELGERSMSARKVERATQAPGEKRDVDLTCDVCGFDAASPAGLGAHKRSHD